MSVIGGETEVAGLDFAEGLSPSPGLRRVPAHFRYPTIAVIQTPITQEHFALQ
jgi:hypothetical protein